MKTANRSPLEEIAKRTGEAGAGLAAAASAVGLQDHQAMLRDHRQRVRDDHQWAKELRGQMADGMTGDDVGDIVITGDIYGADMGALRGKGAPNSEPPAWKKWLLPLGIAAAIGAGSAGTIAIQSQRQPAADQPKYEAPRYDVEKWTP